MDFKDIFLILGFAIGGLVLWGLLFSQVFSLFKSITSSRWPMTIAKIHKVEILEDDDDGIIYLPKVEYSYSVNGNQYTSTTFAFGYMQSSSKSNAQHIYRKISSSPTLNVSYNPRDPREAVLFTGIQKFHIKQLWLLIFLLLSWYPLTLVWVVIYNELSNHIEML